ncbi:MAG: arylsulfatase [Phaeodactylibacter sp.]|uniref:arylsulfatase n=1 Tax=Phaeodactylibacter sp. TaxID=1940289 RepID=UPI0032F08200
MLLAVSVSACTAKQETSQQLSGPIEIKTRPNIILYLADDMGWGDAGCYGQSKISTPNLDAMAAQGIRFTDAYTGSPVCAPSRSTLMEGLHAGHTRVRNNRSLQRELVNFNDSTFTVAQLLKDAGYRTGLFGKWGLAEPGTEGIPTKKGFDAFYGFLDQRKAHYYYVDSLWENEQEIPVPLSEEKQYSSADWYFDKAKGFIRKEAATDTPFFAYIPTQLPHLYMPYEPAEIYKDKPWPVGDKRWATMIHTIDQQMGQLLDLVDSLGIAENTLIVFMSDNGGGNGQRHFYHDARFFNSNGPFRGMKRDLFEGGIRVPLIAQWEGFIEGGIVSAEPVAYYDLMATAGELAENPPQRTDGTSWVPLLTGKADTLARDYLYWEFPYMDQPNAKFAVRKGKWKGVKEWMGGPLQIYNLEEDPGELYNWHYERPDLVAEFEAIIQKEHEPSPYWPIRGEK